MDIGNDAILGSRVRQADGFRQPLEEIDNRGATKLKCVGADVLLQGLETLTALKRAEVKQNLKAIANLRTFDLLKSCQIEEEVLPGKCEILLDKPVAKETSVGIWQKSLFP